MSAITNWNNFQKRYLFSASFPGSRVKESTSRARVLGEVSKREEEHLPKHPRALIAFLAKFTREPGNEADLLF